MKITRDWIILLSLTLVTIAAWIGFEVYRIWHTPTFTTVLEEQMRALDPKIDQEALKILRSASGEPATESTTK